MTDDLEALRTDDALLTQLGTGTATAAGTGSPVADVLGGLRAALDREADTLAPVTLPSPATVTPLRSRRTSRNRAAAVVTGVVLAFAGTGVAAAASGPGATLYPLRNLLGQVVPALGPSLHDRAVELLDHAAGRIHRDASSPGIDAHERRTLNHLLTQAAVAVDRVPEPERAPLAARLEDLQRREAALPPLPLPTPPTPAPTTTPTPTPDQHGQTSGSNSGGNQPQGSTSGQNNPEPSNRPQGTHGGPGAATTGSGADQPDPTASSENSPANSP